MKREGLAETPSFLPHFRHPVDGARHAGGDAEDIASRPWRERDPVIETSYAGGRQPIEQVLLAEIERLSIGDLLTTIASDHDDALAASGGDPDRSPLPGQ